MHHFEQYPSRMTLEMIKVPGAQRKDATKGEGNSSPNPENRGNFPACSLRKIDRILSQMPFFLTFFSCRGSRRVEKGKKILSRGKCLQGVKMPETVPTMLLARGWSAGLQSVTYNSSTVWTPAESPRSHRWPCITLRVTLLGPQRNWAAQSF